MNTTADVSTPADPGSAGDVNTTADISTPADPGTVSDVGTAAVWDSARLLAFFAQHGRDLPWRHRSAGPWGVLVSEVMLQQTPAARVLPVYSEWMERWAEPSALAAAPVAEALRVWGRLGYPRRALRLHEAARAIMQHHGGEVPADLATLLTLPGVGEYTARAIAAFAFGQRHAVVDTNVRRVLSRAVRGVDEHGPATAVDRAELAALLPEDPPTAARVSAAIMELGALVCTATSPACAVCPISDTCRWRAAGFPPGPARRPAQRWHGTDRKMRGEIMAALRHADGPLDREQLAAATTSYPGNETQWQRCVASLISDGLAERDRMGRIGLPGQRV